MAIQDNSPVKYYFTTKAMYDYMAEKEEGAIYYLTDTNELMLGEIPIAPKSVESLEITGVPEKDTDAVNKIYVDSRKTEVDDTLSSTSENPVQNKVINNALSSKANNYYGYMAYGSFNVCSADGNLVLRQKTSFTDPDNGRTYQTYNNRDSRIRNMLDPVLDGDAVPKRYADGLTIEYNTTQNPITASTTFSDIQSILTTEKRIKARATEYGTVKLFNLASYDTNEIRFIHVDLDNNGADVLISQIIHGSDNSITYMTNGPVR